jgi:predicted adenine nucleotide alpha hydrolase (AANH) superfamily ATPase
MDSGTAAERKTMKIFLHMCCAPCALYPFFRLREEGMRPTGYFYNPNIHPYTEYKKRIDTVKDFSLRVGLEVLSREGYDLDEFLLRVAGKGPQRCEFCYRMRLSAAAAAAREKGFTLYTTTLLYSKYQKHDMIIGIAREAAEENSIEFYYEDFRQGWREGIMESKAMGLYRQQYCGCIYSERDRYYTKQGRIQVKR